MINDGEAQPLARACLKMCCRMCTDDCSRRWCLLGQSSTKGIVNTQLTILWMCKLMSFHIVMYNSLASLTFY